MKISKTEHFCIVVTLILVGFVLGYYVRGAAIRDAVVIETEKAAPSETIAEITEAIPTEPAVLEAVTAAPEVAPSQSFAPEAPAENTVEVSGLVNINTAAADELDTLPGIGPVLAERIIAFREEYGSFTAKDELMLVSGIGEKTFENLENLITVEE